MRWTDLVNIRAAVVTCLLVVGALPGNLFPVVDTCLATEPNEQAARDEMTLKRWSRELDGDQFTVRERAAANLEKAGRAAIDHLEKAAVDGSLEAATRAVAVLKVLGRHQDGPTKRAALEVLTRISASKSQVASAATQALESLKAAERPPAQPRFPIGANRLSIRTRIVNGQKEVNVDEGHRQIKIEEQPDRSLRISITEDAKTTTFDATNAEELRQNHPAVYDLYERFGRGKSPGIPREGSPLEGGDPFHWMSQFSRLPRPPRSGGIASEMQQQRALAEIAAAEAELEAATLAMQRSAREGATREAVEAIAKRIEGIRQRIAEARRALAN